MLIIGSQALKHHGVLNREPLDTDLIGTEKELNDLKKSGDYQSYYPLSATKEKLVANDGHITEFEIADYSPSAKSLLELKGVPEGEVVFADLGLCLLLKESHKYLKNNPYFIKTMRDIQFLRGYIPLTLSDFNNSYLEWFKQREKETYNYSLPKLNQGKSSFFVETEEFYKYDHDTLHEAVALGDRPAYLEYKPEEDEVWCSKDLFDNCDELIKLRGVYEEALVLTLERWLIPNEFRTDPYVGFKVALEKVCTSITSGWFRAYAWENYDRVLGMYSNNFVDQFKASLEAGKIKPFNGSKY